uniref:Uncharacterized protein n=1 Tax=Romanomermis culicivorax TaxID=13658 RepID=A0A915KW57_ROMCU
MKHNLYGFNSKCLLRTIKEITLHTFDYVLIEPPCKFTDGYVFQSSSGTQFFSIRTPAISRWATVPFQPLSDFIRMVIYIIRMNASSFKSDKNQHSRQNLLH